MRIGVSRRRLKVATHRSLAIKGIDAFRTVIICETDEEITNLDAVHLHLPIGLTIGLVGKWPGSAPLSVRRWAACAYRTALRQ
jgi:hypothetical protein